YVKWYINGSVDNSLENLTTISSANTTKGDNWTCEVTPFDGTENGTAKNSTQLTIENTQPMVSGFSMDDDDPGIADYQINPITNSQKTFYAWFNATDIDGSSDINTTWIKTWDSGGSESVPTYTNYSMKEVTCAGNTCFYNGSISIWYYDQAGEWNISVYANDTSSATASYNDNFTLTLLTGFTLTNAPIDFGSLQPDLQNQNATTNKGFPLTAENKGNQPLALNISSAGNLTGVSDSTKSIPIENIDYANTSAFTAQSNLTTNSTTFTSSLTVNNTHDLYFRITTPQIKAQQYNSSVTIETT
ncbi:MAG: hypothetical protein KAU20_02140, partial [Nanoarchaeota archaeon]|nr:hypothetical protein [Nanoarchaeota archaeon]